MWRRGPVCVRVYARVLVPPNIYIHTYITTHNNGEVNSSASGVCGRTSSPREALPLLDRGPWTVDVRHVVVCMYK